MRILIERSQEIEVTGVPSILLAGPIRGIGVFDMSRALFPGPPVVAAVAALDLVGRRRRAPQKFLRKLAGVHVCWAMIAKTITRMINASARRMTTPIGPTTAATARSVDIASGCRVDTTSSACCQRKVPRATRPAHWHTDAPAA